jgi:hypothetical protein
LLSFANAITVLAGLMSLQCNTLTVAQFDSLTARWQASEDDVRTNH